MQDRLRSPLAVALVAVLALLAPTAARAAVEPFGVRLGSDGMVIDVPYSMGTHHEHVTSVEGTLQIDPQALRVAGGHLTIPLSAFHDDDAQRACHLREALGLDYTRSRYPRDHVCDDENRLPSSGPDAIAYPRVVIDLQEGAAANGKAEVDGKLTVHGVTRPIHLALEVSRDAPQGMLRVHGRIPLRLSDFGVKVKSAGVLFVTISVRDDITIHLDTLLEPLRR